MHAPVLRASHPPISPLSMRGQQERDTTGGVVLIGFKRQGNLGLGYLAATLGMHGYPVEVVDFEDPVETVLATARRTAPVIVGFSLIFQFHVLRFEALARYLRANGISCHFTMGGHFPSLSSEATMCLVPQLDSVVRFEGELTLLELVDALSAGRDWHSIQGLVYRTSEGVSHTPLRPLLADLDELPYPHRTVDTRRILGRVSAQLIASRGCARTCSFCSIHMFYRIAPGKIVRVRKPVEVAREMRMLYEDMGATILLFQDDDFPMFGKAWHRWCRELLEEMARQELIGRVLWKINCRADATDPRLLAEMRDAGLYLVYMGLESGTERGLQTLHKEITVDQNLRAIEILKELRILFDFGFMMLDPSSTFESILENIKFLRTIVGDGSAAAEFCRMIPYDGTPIQEELARTGRLRGDVLNPDYDFADPRLDVFFREVNKALNVTGWIHGLAAVSAQLKFAWNEFAIMERLTPWLAGLTDYKAKLLCITRQSNEVLFETGEQIAHCCRDGTSSSVSKRSLAERSRIFVDDLLRERDSFVLLNKTEFLRALEPARERKAAKVVTSNTGYG